jgi:hypothetical protein
LHVLKTSRVSERVISPSQNVPLAYIDLFFHKPQDSQNAHPHCCRRLLAQLDRVL